MVQQTGTPGFGLPTQGVVQTQALDSLLPWMTYLPTLARDLALAQNSDQAANQRASIAANASMFGDTTRANATIGAAQIGAGATIDAQQIQTKGMLQALQAQINADAIRYRNGDIAAGQRLQASLRQQAELKNTDTALTLAKMMGSGQLRDSIGARLALRGMGQMPGVSSALNGLENRLWADTNRTVDMPPEYDPVKVNMSVGGGVGGGYSSGFGAGGSTFRGGGTGAIANSNLGGQYADLFNQLKGTVNFGDVFKFGNTPTPVTSGVATSAPIQNQLRDPSAGINPNVLNPNAPEYKATVAQLNDFFGMPKAAKGGKFKNQAALVGDSPSGKPTGVEEIVVGKDFKVIPLHRAAFGYPPKTSGTFYDVNQDGVIDPQKTSGSFFDVNQDGTIDPPKTSGTFYDRDQDGVIDPGGPSAFPTPQSQQTVSEMVGGFAGGGPIYGAGNKPTAERIGMKNLRSSRPMSNLPSKKFGTPADGAVSPPAPAAPNTPQTQPTGGVTINLGGGQGPLADINSIPALQQIRTGNVLPAFGIGPTSFSEAGLGISDTPAPYTRAATFNAMSPAEQEDILQMWEFLGKPRNQALFEMASTTPGFRMNPTRAFGF